MPEIFSCITYTKEITFIDRLVVSFRYLLQGGNYEQSRGTSKLSGLLPLNAPSAACRICRAQKDKWWLNLSSNSKTCRKVVYVKNPVLSPFGVNKVTVEWEKLYSLLQQ